jgi:hypothetical protein
MRLYYMTSYDTATKYILPEHRMRLSQFDRLNDPFELRSVRLEEKKGREAYKALLKHWHKKLGVICMGQHWRSPVMWAHYADSHKGVCLGFDVPDEATRRIKYAPERIALKLDRSLPLLGINKEILEELLITKYAHWEYEQEWRLWSKLDRPDPINGEYYLPFGPTLMLREIIIGARCKRSATDFEKLLGRVEQSITITKARPAFATFEMVTQQTFKPVLIKPRP